jgi:integrase
MLIRVEQGKGRKDRYVMLSPHLLNLLRAWWKAARPQGWRFPGRDPAQPMTTRQLDRGCHAAAQMAEINKRVSPHTLRHRDADRPHIRSIPDWVITFDHRSMSPVSRALKFAAVDARACVPSAANF